MFRRLPREDPNKTVEESRMDAWKDLVEDVQRSQPASSVENPHYAPPNLVRHRGLLLPTFPYPTLKPFPQATFLRHTAKSQGFSTLNPKAHIPGSVCQLWRESLKQILSQSSLSTPSMHFCAADCMCQAIIWDPVEKGSFSYMMLMMVIEDIEALLALSHLWACILRC